VDNNALWYVDGQWVHPNQAQISLNDLAVLRGYSTFEALRTYHRQPFHLDKHLNRLYHSAELIELSVPWTHEEIAAIISEIIERNTYTQASIRILVTGGLTEDGILPLNKPTLVVLISPLGERDLSKFEHGYTLITTRLQRETPEAKTTSYVSAIRALKAAARHHADDALFVNEQNQALEGTRSNFFIFRGNTLVTPRQGVLPGITRNVVLELAKGRFPIEERPILLEELSLTDEAFVTSSSREITPVVQIDDIVIGNGKPGKHTWELEQLFIEMVEREFGA
jgi:branched-chain amino acid aminotransferase